MVTLMKNRGENLVTQFLYNLIFFFLTTLNGQSLEIEERGYKDCNGNYMAKNFHYALVLNFFLKVSHGEYRHEGTRTTRLE